MFKKLCIGLQGQDKIYRFVYQPNPEDSTEWVGVNIENNVLSLEYPKICFIAPNDNKSKYDNDGERCNGTVRSQIYCKLSVLLSMSSFLNVILLLDDSVVIEVKILVASMGNLREEVIELCKAWNNNYFFSCLTFFIWKKQWQLFCSDTEILFNYMFSSDWKG